MRGVCASLCLLLCLCGIVRCVWGDLDEEVLSILSETEDDISSLESTKDQDILWSPPRKSLIFSVLREPEVVIEEDVLSEVGVESPTEEEVQHPPLGTPSVDSDIATVKQLADKIDNLMSEVKAQQNKITELEQINKKLQDKVDSIEQQTKTNNLIFFNVHENKHETYKTTFQKVFHVITRIMKVRAGYNDVSVALRADGNSTENRPIVVRFANFATRMKVLAARNKLINTNIVVAADYSEQVNKRREELLPYLYGAKGLGYNAYISYDKLVVNGVKMTLKELQAVDSQKDNKPAKNPGKKEEDPDEQFEEVEVDPQFQDYEYEDA